MIYDGKLAGERKQSSNPVTTVGKGKQVSIGYEGINVPKTRWSKKFQGLARNPNVPYFVRYNACQALLIDIALLYYHNFT